MGFESSLHMPDKVLNFVKDHFLMDGVIRSAPLLRTQSVRYTQIAVQRVQGLRKVYDVMFLGTGVFLLFQALLVDAEVIFICSIMGYNTTSQ